MTTGEIISSALAVLALLISTIIAYLTLLSRFSGIVLPKRRINFANLDGCPCLVLECECLNEGAKAGTIEDILVRMNSQDTGTQIVFIPHLIREQFNILQPYLITDFSTFSGISLGAKQRKELFVVFKPNQSSAQFPVGTAIIHMSSCTNVNLRKWIKSPIRFSIDLNENRIKEWEDPSGRMFQLPAIEIGQSRSEYLRKSQQ